MAATSFARPFLHHRTRHAVAAVSLALASCPAIAQATPLHDAIQDVRQFGQRWVESALPAVVESSTGALRMEVLIGELDTRLRLAPCQRIEPYVPAGMRLWGNSRLGLRCLEGPVRWNVFLPVTVKAWGQAWLLKHPVSTGATVTAADVVRGEADWAALPSPVVLDLAQWVGQSAAMPLSAGQPLRQAMLRPSQMFPAGAQVRVVVEGSGFAVTTDGMAVSPGLMGQPARVRTENGRILSGTVLDARTVQVRL
jgi:flagella basal body P-ring formation protein FlgA